MVEIKGQESFGINIVAVNKRTKEKPVKKETDPRKRILAKDSVIYEMPGEILDQRSIGKTQKSGWVVVKDSKGRLTKIEINEEIPLYVPDNIPTVLEAGAVVYTFRNRLIKPK